MQRGNAGDAIAGGELGTNLKEIFAANLRTLIANEFGGRASRFATELGVSPGLVSRWLGAKVFPETKYIDQMMQDFDWTTEMLFHADKSETPVISLPDAIKTIAAHWSELELRRKDKK
jgi:hypothetical protein